MGWNEVDTTFINTKISKGKYSLKLKNYGKSWSELNNIGFQWNDHYTIRVKFRQISGETDFAFGFLWGVSEDLAQYELLKIYSEGLFNMLEKLILSEKNHLFRAQRQYIQWGSGMQ